MMVNDKKRLGLRWNSGQTLVEFAISLLTFLVLVFAIIDFSYLFFVKLTLQNAVRQAGRYAITGQSMTGQSRFNSIQQTVQHYSMGLATTTNTSICATVKGCSSGGGPGDTVTITVSYPYQFITPILRAAFKNGTYTISVTTSYKNEPFPPGQT